MPILNNIETVSAEQAWQSPDGKIKIFDIVIQYEGKKVKTSTFSGKIATVGFNGDVETYEKKDKTYIRQVQTGGQYGGQYSSAGTSKPMDTSTMYVSYAKDLAVALIGADGKLDDGKLANAIQAVAGAGVELRTLVESPTQAKEFVESGTPVTEDELGISLNNIVDVDEL